MTYLNGWLSLIALVLACLSQQLSAQDKSVRPGINDSFVDADPATFVERFEKEGREVYDFREKIVAACKLKPGMAVADIGAGTGLFTRLMSPQVGNDGIVFAVDISENFIKHIEVTCREAGMTNVKGVVCTPTSVELPPKSADVAFICDTYHHFEFPYKTMRSIHNALKPDGELVLVEFHRIEGTSSDWALGHIRAPKEVFVEEICRAGFKVVGEENFMKESYLVRFQRDARVTERGHTTDSVDVVKELLANETALLIDVREEREWNSGHLAQATLFPLSKVVDVAEAKSQEVQQEILKTLPKDRIIYCHCGSGVRVLRAAELLRPLGYDIRPLKIGYDGLLDAGLKKAE